MLGVWREEVGYLPGGGGVRGLAGGGVPGLCFFSSSILRFASSVTVFSLVSAVCRGGGDIYLGEVVLGVWPVEVFQASVFLVPLSSFLRPPSRFSAWSLLCVCV